jgi:predicted acylesterase/phospholipase RssA
MIIGTWRDSYDQLSFSGGGLRCFWQGGALDVLREYREVKPQRIAAASGGALSAACFVSECGDRLIESFAEELEKREHNFEADPDADDIEDLTPHQELYARVVGDVIDKAACERIANGPPFEVLLARPPQKLPTRWAATLTVLLYEADKALRSTPHGRWAQAAGAREIRVDARKAAREGNLVDLVCLAATIPPVFDIRQWRGEPVIDAGTVDNAPMPEPDEGYTLVLLTRAYRNLPHLDRRTYIHPSESTPASKIDFTDAQALRATYRQGREDMKKLLSGLA